MTAYYNEWDKQAAAWLRELIKQGHIADGEVDERDIKEVKPEDLRGFTQCHFFAGIGGWSVALRLAGWADDRPVWTGSPPCQPFSVAGRGKGIEDERHIAPVWLDLVKECRPSILFGEQVAAATSKDGWLDSLQDALENEGYATGAAVLPACSVNAPHMRQRLWFTARLAYTNSPRLQGHGKFEQQHGEKGWEEPIGLRAEGSNFGGMAHTASNGHSTTDGLQKAAESSESKGSNCFGQPARSSDLSGLADTAGVGLEEQVMLGGYCFEQLPQGILSNVSDVRRRTFSANAPAPGWDTVDWLFCRDGKWRPVEPSTFPLAHGISARVGRLRGYGNAIVPQVAAEVIQVMMEYGND